MELAAWRWNPPFFVGNLIIYVFYVFVKRRELMYVRGSCTRRGVIG
nr:MAG TPA: hypothetical protein [Caudoviricetes sp.]